jgi:probable addiction module antidote protein
MTTEYTVFDASKYLDSDEMVAEYLTACAEDDNPDVLLAALADVAKARGMKQVAEAAGLGRESLYKTLAPRAHPRFRTIQAILKALNVRVVLKPPSDLERVDAHVIQPEEYADAPEITDAMLERADLYEGDKLIRRGRRPLASRSKRSSSGSTPTMRCAAQPPPKRRPPSPGPRSSESRSRPASPSPPPKRSRERRRLERPL